MKKAVAIAAALAAALFGSAALAQGQEPKEAKPAAEKASPAQGTNEIAEKLAFKAAHAIRDPKKRAAAFEAFVEKYPDSQGKIAALQQAVAAHAEAGDHAKVEEIGKRILDLEPTNVRVMALVAVQKRNRAYRGEDVQNLARRVRELGEKGLEALPDWPKPSGIDDNQFQRLRDELTAIFTDAVAYGAFQARDYKTARDQYLKTFEQHPDSFFDIYHLGVACLEMTPPDPRGFWYVAKALSLAQRMKNPKAVAAILAYGKGKYETYTGSGDGWDQIVMAAARQKQPPANFIAGIARKQKTAR
jgi:tetratricopeptide (TPR) repeat protein